MKKSNSFTIYDASAGSGKTFTLVKEYLVLLLSSHRKDAYKNILAITFTNKAVAEMKTRIIESLNVLSANNSNRKGEGLHKLLTTETGLSSEEITKRSRIILKSIINNYAAFEVSTIDGFTHRVIRTFAKDLDLPLNFEVELNTEEVLNEAVDRLISKAGENHALTRVLVSFVLSKADEDKSWDISRDLLNIAKLLTEETNRPFLELLKHKDLEDFSQLADILKKQLAEREHSAVEFAHDFFALLSAEGLENSDFTRSSCPKFFAKILRKDFHVELDLQWQEKIGSQNLYSKSLVAEKKKILDRLQPQIENLFLGVKNNLLNIQFLKAIEKNLVPLSLLTAIQNEIEEIKKEKRILLISDFNATISGAVKDQPAPFIYERLGERYRHYFIDEFQDTSQLQWENLIPLIDHTLSIEHPAGEYGSLTLVGDAKQSIYRWRGGKAEQFMELCRGENPFLLEEKKIVVLPQNYRSAKTIVNFNNDFFNFSATCLENGKHKALFESCAQDPVSEQEGYVNISFVEAENAEEEMKAYPLRVLEIIRSLEAENISRKNICILTRKKKETIAVASLLSEHGISVISAESLLLTRSPEVRFINAILKYTLDSADKDLKFEILDFLVTSLQLDDHFSFLKDRLELKEQAFFDSLQSLGVDFSVENLNSLTVYEGVEYIIRSFGLIKDSDAYLQFYLDFVYESSHSAGAGIFEFLELWDQKKEHLSIVVPRGEDAVQIMTIHRAKGLEFPVVIYPFANSPIKDTARESFWMDLPEELDAEIQVAYLNATERMKTWGGEAALHYEELCFNSQLDALNILYVALTRPVQRLYVITKMELDKKGGENRNKFSGLFISYLKHLGKWTGAAEYQFGSLAEFTEAEPERHRAMEQHMFHSSPTESNGISIVTRSGLLWNSKQQSAIEKGHLVHELFAGIHFEGDVEDVLRNAREKGYFQDQEESEIRAIIQQVIEHPELKQFFSKEAKSFTERDLLSASGEILRPDRLNFVGKKVSIIDYKTGVEDQKHREQILKYDLVLDDMGFEVDKKLLVYLNNGVSITVV